MLRSTAAIVAAASAPGTGVTVAPVPRTDAASTSPTMGEAPASGAAGVNARVEDERARSDPRRAHRQGAHALDQQDIRAAREGGGIGKGRRRVGHGCPPGQQEGERRSDLRRRGRDEDYFAAGDGHTGGVQDQQHRRAGGGRQPRRASPRASARLRVDALDVLPWRDLVARTRERQFRGQGAEEHDAVGGRRAGARKTAEKATKARLVRLARQCLVREGDAPGRRLRRVAPDLLLHHGVTAHGDRDEPWDRAPGLQALSKGRGFAPRVGEDGVPIRGAAGGRRPRRHRRP